MTISTEKRTESVKKVLFPVLEECSKLTLDPYWKQVFEECARGKFPRGSGIDASGKLLHFHSKNSTKGYITYKLQNTPEVVFTDLKKIFSEDLNLNSNKDRQDIRNELNDLCKDLQDTFTGSWVQIKRKKIKDPIIRQYILDLKSKYNLSNAETAEVAQIIKLGFLFNWIPNENVDYENRQILEITNLHFDENERVFDLEEPFFEYKREYKPKMYRLSSLWSKHLEKPRNCYVL